MTTLRAIYAQAGGHEVIVESVEKTVSLAPLAKGAIEDFSKCVKAAVCFKLDSQGIRIGDTQLGILKKSAQECRIKKEVDLNVRMGVVLVKSNNPFFEDRSKVSFQVTQKDAADKNLLTSSIQVFNCHGDRFTALELGKDGKPLMLKANHSIVEKVTSAKFKNQKNNANLERLKESLMKGKKYKPCQGQTSDGVMIDLPFGQVMLDDECVRVCDDGYLLKGKPTYLPSLDVQELDLASSAKDASCERCAAGQSTRSYSNDCYDSDEDKCSTGSHAALDGFCRTCFEDQSFDAQKQECVYDDSKNRAKCGQAADYFLNAYTTVSPEVDLMGVSAGTCTSEQLIALAQSIKTQAIKKYQNIEQQIQARAKFASKPDRQNSYSYDNYCYDNLNFQTTLRLEYELAAVASGPAPVCDWTEGESDPKKMDPRLWAFINKMNQISKYPPGVY